MHARLLDRIGADDLARVFKRDRNCCHVCGVSVPGYMEIDHVAGHKPCTIDALRTICTFCHDLKHPLWAASRKRIVPIHAPDLSQVDISRLAWSMISRSGDEGFDIPTLREDLLGRADRIREILSCKDAESLFEAAFTLDAAIGRKPAGAVFHKIEQVLRFAPSVLFTQEVRPGSGLSSWRFSGFVDFFEGASAAAKISAMEREKLETLARAVEEAWGE